MRCTRVTAVHLYAFNFRAHFSNTLRSKNTGGIRHEFLYAFCGARVSYAKGIAIINSIRTPRTNGNALRLFTLSIKHSFHSDRTSSYEMY